MSNFMFRPAVKENVGLIIGLIGPSGSGKTFSALRLATGLSNGKSFAGIDTESRRMLHYADMFKFDHAELPSPFRPDNYAEAIKAADSAGYPVIIVDSCSHEWAGEGGILDWQEEELTRMAGDDYRKREACKMASWIKPKMSHKQMVQKLLQIKAHLVLCFRAEEKTGMEKDPSTGKTVIVQKGWQPICEKNMPYELTMSFLLTPDAPGMPKPIKLQEQHKAAIDIMKPLNEDAGKRLAQWATSTKVASPPSQVPTITEPPKSGKPLNAKQGAKIIEIAANLKSADGEPTPLSMEEAKKVIDWYCNDPENKHNGRTFESGQALIHGFSTILDRFLDHKEKETNNV